MLKAIRDALGRVWRPRRRRMDDGRGFQDLRDARRFRDQREVSEAKWEGEVGPPGGATSLTAGNNHPSSRRRNTEYGAADVDQELALEGWHADHDQASAEADVAPASSPD